MFAHDIESKTFSKRHFFMEDNITTTDTKVKAKTPRTDQWNVLFGQLVFSADDNNRILYGNIEELMFSIVAAGEVLKALSVYRIRGTENFKVKAGHRRCFAVKMGIERGLINPDTFRIPVRVCNPEPEDKRLLDQLEENTGGQPNTMLEEAIVYQKLAGLGYTPERIAEKRRKSITHVANCFKLLKVGEKLRQFIIDDVIAATQVVKMLKNNTAEEVEKMVVDAYEAQKDKKLREKMNTGTQTSMFSGSEIGYEAAIAGYDDIGSSRDNTKSAGKSGMNGLDEDSGDAVVVPIAVAPDVAEPKVKVTAKNLSGNADGGNKPMKFNEKDTKNLILSALVGLSDWKQYSTADATTLEGLKEEVDEWFQANKNTDGYRYF